MAGTAEKPAAKCLLLHSSVPSNTSTESLQMLTRTIIGSMGIVITEIDGAVADNKEIRSRMWAISEQRAVYPQVFLQDEAGELTFVAAGEGITDLNDEGSLKGLLASAPRKAE